MADTLDFPRLDTPPSCPLPDPTVIRVVLADDHPLFNRGLSRFIEDEEGLVLVGRASNGQDALDVIREHLPDVAVLDIDMPVRTGLDVLAAVVEEGLPTRVVMLTGSVQEEFVFAAITAGAHGYLVKTMDWPDIMQAIRQVAAGKTVVDPSMTNTLAGALQSRRAHEDTRLKGRESAVLSLTASHMTAREISIQMGISERMVKKHLTAIYKKLGVDCKTHAITEAVRRGLVK